MAADRGAGRYKTYDNRIDGSRHVPVPTFDVPLAMADLVGWFARGRAIPYSMLPWFRLVDPRSSVQGRERAYRRACSQTWPSLSPGFRTFAPGGADLGMYLEALAASDDGDILPLYDLFQRSLRRAVNEMEKRNYVERKVRGDLLNTGAKRYRRWRTSMESLSLTSS